MKLLLIASDAREFGGLLRHCTNVRKIDASVDWARAASLGEYEIAMAVNGAGAKRSAAAVDAVITRFAADALLSVGFCGALDPRLRHFDVVVGGAVVEGDGRFPAGSPRASRTHHTGVVVTLDHVAGTAREKSQLHAEGAVAVEMEAAGVACRSQQRGLPFFCIKTVTDLADESLMIDYNAALRSDGHFDTIKILASSLRRPWVRLPELYRLRSRLPLATRTLGDFIADCRF